MNDKIKNAFFEIHADENLKRKTFETLITKKAKRSIPRTYKLAPIMAVFVLLFIRNLYYTPISYISIDINPSIELEVNRFGRVIQVTASNEDATNIIDAVNLSNMNYLDALETLKSDDSFKNFAENYTEITVISNSDESTDIMINSIESCDFYGENVQCYGGNSNLKAEALASGISFGKYRAYLKLREVNPTISVDDIKEMSMSQIRNLIDNGDKCSPNSDKQENFQNGYRHGKNK